MDYDLTYLSLGGGVQSSAMLVMAAQGKYGVPRPDVAIFADTQGEIAKTYTWLDKLKSWAERAGIKVVFTTKGSLENDVLVGVGKSHASIPAFIKNEDGSKGIQRRLCTWDYKLMALEAEVRRQLGLKKGQRAKGVYKCRALIGISYDEIVRMKPSRLEWIDNAYPLVDAKLTRTDCQKFLMDEMGEVPPRSSCYFCPHHSDEYWKWIRDEHPGDFHKAIEFDAKLRHSQPGLRGEAFLHGSMVPLSEAKFRDRKPSKVNPDGLAQECEGMCGV